MLLLKNMKEKTTKPWQLTRWKKRRKELLKQQCSICGSKNNLVLHHLQGKHGEAYEQYLSLNEKEITTLCKKCHFRIHRGYVLCMNCEKKWHKKKWEVCFDCLPNYNKEKEKWETFHNRMEWFMEKAYADKYRNDKRCGIEYHKADDGGGLALPKGLVSACVEFLKKEGYKVSVEY